MKTLVFCWWHIHMWDYSGFSFNHFLFHFPGNDLELGTSCLFQFLIYSIYFLFLTLSLLSREHYQSFVVIFWNNSQSSYSIFSLCILQVFHPFRFHCVFSVSYFPCVPNSSTFRLVFASHLLICSLLHDHYIYLLIIYVIVNIIMYASFYSWRLFKRLENSENNTTFHEV